MTRFASFSYYADRFYSICCLFQDNACVVAQQRFNNYYQFVPCTRCYFLTFCETKRVCIMIRVLDPRGRQTGYGNQMHFTFLLLLFCIFSCINNT